MEMGGRRTGKTMKIAKEIAGHIQSGKSAYKINPDKTVEILEMRGSTAIIGFNGQFACFVVA